MVGEDEFRDCLSKLDIDKNERDTPESAETALYSTMSRCKYAKIEIVKCSQGTTNP